MSIHGIPISTHCLKLFLLLLILSSGCSRVGTSADIDEVNGENTMRHIEKIVSYGPHPPGSEAQKKVGAYIVDQLKSSNLEVQTHTFEPVTPHGHLQMTNIWGVVNGKRDQVIILASHYDSKYFENFPFVGANDGASSSGLLLELARILAKRNRTDFTLWFVFFDGEEALLEWTSADSLYGSREFVKMLKRSNQLNTISALILLDMVGEKDLLFYKDGFSTAWLKNIIWMKAAELGHDDIFKTWGSVSVQDDHIPFVEEGIPVVNIIDLNYAYWHTSKDTPDRLSAENLEIVGNVVLASLPEIMRYLDGRR